MRIPTALGVLAAAGSCVALVACNTGTSKPKNSVWFGPGSAPNSGTGVSQAGVGQFTPTQNPMNEARIGHSATVLNNGLVLVIGGRNALAPSPNATTTESELYDPATDSWTYVSQLPANQGNNNGYMMDQSNAVQTRRQEHSAAVLGNGGTVLITGGLGIDNALQNNLGALRSCYRFEPTNNTFFKVQDMFEARYFHQSHVMINGDALVTGGINSFGGIPAVAVSTLLSSEQFNAINGWTQVTGTTLGGHLFGNMHMFNGKTLVSNGVFIDAVAPQGAQVSGAIVRGVNTGCIWPGGSTNGQFPGNSGVLFDPNQQPPPPQFQPGPGSIRQLPPAGIILSGSASLSTGDLFFAGGENLQPGSNTKDQGALSSVEILRAATGQMDPGPDIGSSQAPVTLPSGQTVPAPPVPITELECEEIGVTSDVLMCGGVLPSSTPTTFAEVWSYRFNFMIGPPISMNKARQGHRLAKLPGNRILVIGGLDDSQPQVPLADCEIWSR